MQETKGQSKVTVEQVVAIRRLKAQTPALTVAAIKDQLNVPLSTMAIGRIIRGILHSQVDMCGLPVTPFTHKPQVQARIERKEARKAVRASKKAAQQERSATDAGYDKLASGWIGTKVVPQAEFNEVMDAVTLGDESDEEKAFLIAVRSGKTVSMEVAKNAKGGLEFSGEQIKWVITQADAGRARKDIAADLSVSLSSVARILQGRVK